MKYEVILFDLDGTLLNTIIDIKESVNAAFNNLGFEVNFTEEDIKKFIGSGARVLISRAIEATHVNMNEYEHLLEEYSRIYAIHKNDHTHPFDGVRSTLKLLKEKGIRLGVISNKPINDAVECIDKILPNYFDFVIGSQEGIPTKPNPFIFYLLADKYHIERTKTLYVGDMDVDIDFAQNVKMDMGLCHFGYGNYDKMCGQNYNINKFGDILKIIEKE